MCYSVTCVMCIYSRDENIQIQIKFNELKGQQPHIIRVYRYTVFKEIKIYRINMKLLNAFDKKRESGYFS